MTGKAPQPFTPTPVFNIVVVLTGQSLVIEKQHLGGEGGGESSSLFSKLGIPVLQKQN